MRQDRPMDTDGVASRLFAVVRPQPLVELVRDRVERESLKASAMLFECGLRDEIGNWLHEPKTKEQT
jgi:hypothetical protein